MSIDDDPGVKAAFANGRNADDICILVCPQCFQYRYYNQGNWFTCWHCDRTFYAAHPEELEEIEDGLPYVLIEDMVTVADLWANDGLFDAYLEGGAR